MASSERSPEVEEFLKTADRTLLTPELLAQRVEDDTLLIHAVKNQNLEAVLALLEHQVDPNEVNKKGVTPISAAATKGGIEIIEPLIRYGAKVDSLNTTTGSTALIQASHFGNLEAAKMLILHSARADAANQKGTTALMRASQEGHVGISRLLIEKGADVNRKNLEGMNALMLASQRGHANMARLLTSMGAVVDEQTTQGSTALILACKRGHEQVVKVLVTMGAEIFIKDLRTRTARDTAIKREHTRLLKWLDTSVQRDLIQAEKTRQRMLLFVYMHQAYSRGRLSLSVVPQRAATLYERYIEKPHRAEPMSQADAEAVTHLTARIASNAMERPAPGKRPHVGYADWMWHIVLLKCLSLPEGLYFHIMGFVPQPRIWRWQLKGIKSRSHLDVRQAMIDASSVIDDILTDANIYAGSDQTRLMCRIAVNPQLHPVLEHALGLKKQNLVEMITKNSDLQSLLHRTTDADCTFKLPLARRLFRVAVTLFKWQLGRSCAGRAMGYTAADADAQASADLGCTAREDDRDDANHMTVDESPSDKDRSRRSVGATPNELQSIEEEEDVVMEQAGTHYTTEMEEEDIEEEEEGMDDAGEDALDLDSEDFQMIV